MEPEKNKAPEFVEKAYKNIEKLNDKEVEELIEKVVEEL